MIGRGWRSARKKDVYAVTAPIGHRQRQIVEVMESHVERTLEHLGKDEDVVESIGVRLNHLSLSGTQRSTSWMTPKLGNRAYVEYRLDVDSVDELRNEQTSVIVDTASPSYIVRVDSRRSIAPRCPLVIDDRCDVAVA